MDQFLMDHLLELEHTLLSHKYDVIEPYTFVGSTDLNPSGSGPTIIHPISFPTTYTPNEKEKVERPTPGGKQAR